MSDQQERDRLRRLQRILKTQERIARRDVAALSRETQDLDDRIRELAAADLSNSRHPELTTGLMVKWLARLGDDLAGLQAAKSSARNRHGELAMRVRLVDEWLASLASEAERRSEERDMSELGNLRSVRRDTGSSGR